MQRHHTEQPLTPQRPQQAIDPQLIVIGGLFLLILVIVLIQQIGYGSKKKKLGDARFATDAEIRKAKKYGYAMMEKRSRAKIALWIGEPQGVTIDKQKREIVVPRDYRSFILSHLEEHFMCIGSTGSGKTYSFLAPMQRCMIKLGYPLAIFDAKGHEESEIQACPSSEIAGYARLHGYKIKIIAPSYDDSDVFNLFQMIQPRFGREAYEDKDGAGVVAEVLSENLAKTARDKGDEFFPLAAKQLLQSVFLLALYLDPKANFVLAYYLLERLVEVGAAGIRALKLPLYLESSFSQYLASEKSPETGASIAGTTLLQFNRLFTAANVATFCGESTIDLSIKGKTLVIFRMNPQLKASLGPTIATAIQCFMLSNCYSARTQPLGFFLDECQMVKICGVQEMLTVARSNGVFFNFATQGFSFIEDTYQKGAMGLIEGCKNQVLGGFNGKDTAEYFGKQLGQQQIQTKSSSRSQGKNSSRSFSEQPHLKDLVSIQELMGLPQGTFIVLNRSIKNKRLSRIPVRFDSVIPQWEVAEMKAGIAEWFRYRVSARQQSPVRGMTDERLLAYRQLANESLPDPQAPAPESEPEVEDQPTLSNMLDEF